jgi:hypothetical protein
MEPLNILDNLQIATPCQASWNAMRGDDRARFCDLCSKNVYNLSGLTATEAATVISESGGSVCVRLYRRSDGTVLTADCPVGLRRALWRRLRRLATAAVVAAAAVWSGVRLYALGLTRPDAEFSSADLGETLADWRDSLAEVLGLWRRPRFTMGVISLCPPQTTPIPEPAPPEAEGSETAEAEGLQ